MAKTSIKLKHSNTIATIPTTSDLIAGERLHLILLIKSFMFVMVQVL